MKTIILVIGASSRRRQCGGEVSSVSFVALAEENEASLHGDVGFGDRILHCGYRCD